MKIAIPCFLALVALTTGTSLMVAQDKPAEPAKPKTELRVVEEEAKPQGNPTETWKKLAARKLEIFNTLQKLKKDFEAAKGNEAKGKVREQFADLIREFQVEIEPQMVEIAGAVYAADAANQEAAEVVMTRAFNENQYDKAAEISAKLITGNYKTRFVMQTAGVAQYALHNFEEAAGLLGEAAKNNKLDPHFAPYADYAKTYIDLWKTEQAIRDKEAKLEGDQALPRVVFETTKGKIVIELFEDHAPNTVANFISLVEGKKYDGIKFHRVINGFMAQGGDPNTLNDDPSDDGKGGPGYSIKCECHDPKLTPRMHFRGTLSMAHAGRDSGGSQFFITHLPTPWLNVQKDAETGGHTVFGRVVEGLEFAAALRKGDKIQSATVLRKRAHEYKPEVTADPSAKKDAPAEDKKSDDKKPATETKKEPAAESTDKPKAEDKKPEEKKDEPAKDEAKKEEPKKDDAK